MMTWITTFLFSALIHPAPSCHDAFVPLAPIQSSQLEMGQDSVGVDWSNFKNRKEIETAFSERQQTQPEITPQEFVLELTTVKPLKIYYATNGRPYLADGYHKFRGQTTFIGTRKPFVVNTRTLRDYRETNPTTGRPWTLRAMERDLQKNNWIQLRGVDKPTMSDLEQLPDSVLELADSPQRSTIGFLFRSFATPLRGGDFTPMIQFRLAGKMEELGTPILSDTPYSYTNLRRLRNAIASSRELKAFLLKRLSRDISAERRQTLKKFIMQLEAE